MIKYTYVALQYVHDLTVGEFINVGVVVYAPDANFIRAKCRTTTGRIARLFPGVDRLALRQSLKHIEQAFNRYNIIDSNQLAFQYGNSLSPDDFGYSSNKTARQVALSVLPADDSSLQWSAGGSGITDNPLKELSSLYGRLVERYDLKAEREKKSDDDVWRAFTRELENRSLPDIFREKKISAPHDVVTFKYAWQNHIWHCLEPLSFDLASEENIRDKAHKWLGQLTMLEKADETFKVVFLIGGPEEGRFKPAFLDAIGILDAAKIEKEICLEEDFERCASTLLAEVEEHRAELLLGYEQD